MAHAKNTVQPRSILGGASSLQLHITKRKTMRAALWQYSVHEDTPPMTITTVTHVRRATLPLILLALLSSAIAPALAKTQSHTSRRTTAVVPSRATSALGPLPTIIQTLNNCGPASIAEVLSYWGIRRTQDQVQAVVRADGGPNGMAPFGVPGYMRSLGLRAMLGVEGNQRLLKALISNHFPVIVSQWVSVFDHTRHYRPIQAYDDRPRIFLSSDPYLGANHPISYADFASMWAVSHGRFLVLYPPSHQSLLEAVLASAGWNRTTAYRQDLIWQQNRLRHPPSDVSPYVARYYRSPSLAWDLLELGNVAAARQALRQAAVQGVSPVVIGWITREIAWRSASRPRGSRH
jgi:predicted double-glycine peptidase